MLAKNHIDNITYSGSRFVSGKPSEKSLSVIGYDSEAGRKGNPIMFCTSQGDVYKPKELLIGLFSRKYQGKKFVCWNLKYDESAILKLLPLEVLQELREQGKAEHEGYIYRYIAYKYLSIRHNHKQVTFFDIMGFYGGSLNANAKKYLGKSKIDLDPKLFTKAYIKKNWGTIAEYCIQDCCLTQELAEYLIEMFESYGVFPKQLYSTAYITYQYFRQQCKYITVYDYWYNNKQVLDYAVRAYNGGKFEVTRKAHAYYYEYDIISAYPYEIANLVDITNAKVVYSNLYIKDAVYAFFDCTIEIPFSVFSPIPIKIGMLCTYPCGVIRKVITKTEYEYMLSVGCTIDIHDGCSLLVDKKVYPYRDAIEHLVSEKQKYKSDKEGLRYHTVKILLNSLYGKFVQLVPDGERWNASSCWNPIYGAVITANTRIKISAMQQQYSDVCAVHTDSIITTKPIEMKKNPILGDFTFETEGVGMVLGCGVYQIGETVKMRGFPGQKSLMKLCWQGGKKISLDLTHVESWKEAAWRGHNPDAINVFETIQKYITPNFDKKRIWENDYRTFIEIFSRPVDSSPLDGEFLQLSFHTS